MKIYAGKFSDPVRNGFHNRRERQQQMCKIKHITKDLGKIGFGTEGALIQGSCHRWQQISQLKRALVPKKTYGNKRF
jgi:hypothetical protein